MIPQEYFFQAIANFNQIEDARGQLYYRALNLIEHNFQIEAFLLILSTWNFAGFRYALRTFNLTAFENLINDLENRFAQFGNSKFLQINFDDYEDLIVEIFDSLANIEGVKYTGASKIMHLKKPEIFVMWDKYISGHESRRYYNNLDIVVNNYWHYNQYNQSGRGYFSFLKDCQALFSEINYDANNFGRTFTKAIDEFNYVQITHAIQELRRNG